MDNIYRTLDIINFGKRHTETPSAILSLDIEKAFDRVEPTYVHCLFQHTGFGQNFLMALSAIYAAPTASVRINGLDSSPFAILRGTRQGCPLSPISFALAIEPLAEALRHSTKCSGFQIGSQQYRLSLFADDIGLYITDTQSSLPEIESSLCRFH